MYTESVYTGREGGRAPAGERAVAAMTTLRHVTLDSTQTFPLKRPTPLSFPSSNTHPLYI